MERRIAVAPDSDFDRFNRVVLDATSSGIQVIVETRLERDRASVKQCRQEFTAGEVEMAKRVAVTWDRVVDIMGWGHTHYGNRDRKDLRLDSILGELSLRRWMGTPYRFVINRGDGGRDFSYRGVTGQMKTRERWFYDLTVHDDHPVVTDIALLVTRHKDAPTDGFAMAYDVVGWLPKDEYYKRAVKKTYGTVLWAASREQLFPMSDLDAFCEAKAVSA